MLTPSPGYLSPGTVITNITDDGVYAGSLWLNRPLKKGFGKPFPKSPEDMYFAQGFMGQLLIMLPSQNMIIARTGYDVDANSKIDAFVSRAISCFDNPNYKVGKILPTKKVKMTMNKLIKNIRNIFEANTLQASIAKTVCSCHLVSGVDINTCLERNNFSFSKYITKIAVQKGILFDGNISVQVHLSRFFKLFHLNAKNSAKAVYNPEHPEFGCTLK
jgi:hypothetical protein